MLSTDRLAIINDAVGGYGVHISCSSLIMIVFFARLLQVLVIA